MEFVKTILIATHNPAKKQRYQDLLSLMARKVVNLSDLGIKDKPVESGNTAEENSEIKARFYAEKTGLPVFSEDEALYVDFLPEGQQPGVHVRRINGIDEVNDEELLHYWEAIISKVPENERTGHWHVAYCVGVPDGVIKTVTVDHPILFFYPSSAIRIPGWPMSSLEGPLRFGKPHSELTREENEQHVKENDLLVFEKLREIWK